MSISISDYSMAAILGLEDSDQRLSCIPDSSVPRRRRSRTVYTQEAIRKMEELFNETQYPDIQQRERLSAEIGVPEARIQVWFQNRRSRNTNKRRTRRTPSTKTEKRALSEADTTTGATDVPYCESEVENRPSTKVPRLTPDETKVDNTSDTIGQTSEKFPYYFLPPYYNNYFSYPYFYNPAMGHPHYALLTAHSQNPTPTNPFTNSFFNMPLTSSSPFLPSAIPHFNLSTPLISSTELPQVSGVRLGSNLSPSLFSEFTNHMGVRQDSNASPPLFSVELTTQKGTDSIRQMFVPSLKHATRHSIAELSGADGRVDEDVNDISDDIQCSRDSSPAYSPKTESSVSLDSFGASDSGFGQELSSDSW